MTKADMEVAELVHDLALALYRNYYNGEDNDLIKCFSTRPETPEGVPY